MTQAGRAEYRLCRCFPLFAREVIPQWGLYRPRVQVPIPFTLVEETMA